jgi:MFS family permease
MFFSGHIMDRWGRKRQIVPAALTLAGGIALMSATAALALPLALFVVAFVWINIGISMMAGTMQTLGSDVAPPTARGKFFGVNRLVAEAGSLMNPVAFGTVLFLVGGSAGYAGAFGIMAGAAVISAALVGFGLRETLRKDEPQSAKASRD